MIYKFTKPINEKYVYDVCIYRDDTLYCVECDRMYCIDKSMLEVCLENNSFSLNNIVNEVLITNTYYTIVHTSSIVKY